MLIGSVTSCWLDRDFSLTERMRNETPNFLCFLNITYFTREILSFILVKVMPSSTYQACLVNLCCYQFRVIKMNGFQNTLKRERSDLLVCRSGSNQKTLTCATSRDPRVNFPFVAVLNDSNVASLRLQLDRHMPEFIWLGFEGQYFPSSKISPSEHEAVKTKDCLG